MKMKSLPLRVITAFLPIAITSCTNKVQEMNIPQPQVLRQIVMKTQDFEPEADGRTIYQIANDITKCVWAANDTVGIFPDEGGQVYFPMISGAGTQNANFSGGGWALKDASTYVAYYPFIGDIYLDKKAVPVSYMGQVQTGNASAAHLGAFDYMVATPSAPQDGNVLFMFKHLSALVQMKLTIPEPATLKSVKLVADTEAFTLEGIVDIMANIPNITPVTSAKEMELEIQNIVVTENDQSVTLYLMLPPTNLNGQTLKAIIMTDLGVEEFTFEGKNFIAGTIYSLTSEELLDIEIGYDATLNTATLTVEEFDVDMIKAVKKALGKGATSFIIKGTVTESQQNELALSLAEESVVLYLPIAPSNVIDTLKNTDDAISAICYIVGIGNASKGDIAMRNGLFISADNLSMFDDALKAQAAGVVYWTIKDTDSTDEGRISPANLKDDKVMIADYPYCNNGLIVSLKDASDKMIWHGNSFTYESVADNFQNTDKFLPLNTSKSNYARIASSYSSSNYLTGPMNRCQGYNNTKVLEYYNAYCALSDSKKDFIVKPIEALSEFSVNNPAPINTTGWFLPSLKELHMLCYKDVDDVWNTRGTDTKIIINKSLRVLDGDTFGNDHYWSSLEVNGTSGAFSVYFKEASVTGHAKYDDIAVRYICAY